VADPTHRAGTLRPTTRPAGSVCSLIPSQWVRWRLARRNVAVIQMTEDNDHSTLMPCFPKFGMRISVRVGAITVCLQCKPRWRDVRPTVRERYLSVLNRRCIFPSIQDHLSYMWPSYKIYPVVRGHRRCATICVVQGASF
jgi:hypothetical protein